MSAKIQMRVRQDAKKLNFGWLLCITQNWGFLIKGIIFIEVVIINVYILIQFTKVPIWKNHKNGFIWVEDQFMCSEIKNNFAKFLVYKCKKIIEVRVTG